MAFKLLNTEAVKLKTDELIKEAFDAYCAHIALGYDGRSWSMRKDGKDFCCYMTIERYIKSRPDVCDPLQYNNAVSVGMKYWEGIVAESGIGKNQRANTASLQMIMRNKYGWDIKDDAKELDQKIADLRALASALSADREQHAKQSEDRTE